MAAATGLVQDVKGLEAQGESADVPGHLCVPAEFRPVVAGGIAPVDRVARIGGQFEGVRRDIRSADGNPQIQRVHVYGGNQAAAGNAAGSADTAAEGELLPVITHIDGGIGGEIPRDILGKAALSAVETVSFGSAPEIGHESRVVKLVFVQTRQGARSQERGVILQQGTPAHGKGPLLFAVQRRCEIGDGRHIE